MARDSLRFGGGGADVIQFPLGGGRKPKDTPALPGDFLTQERLLSHLSVPSARDAIENWGRRNPIEITRAGGLNALIGVLRDAGFGNFTVPDGTDVSSVSPGVIALCEQLAGFNPAARLKDLRASGGDDGLSRWFALGFTPEVLPEDDEDDGSPLAITCKYGFLRACDDRLYFASTLDQFGVVSPWLAVHPNRLDFSDFK